MSANTNGNSGRSQGDSNLDRKAQKRADPEVLKRGVLALDPGSQVTGWAWWTSAEAITPDKAGVFKGGNGSLGDRLISIRSQLQELYDHIHQWGFQLGTLACEKPIPHHKYKAPELEAMYSEIRSWAKGLAKKRGPSPGLLVRTYANSQVKAVVNPRLGDWKVEGNAKEKLMAGVVSRFGLTWRNYPEDAIDAIAVGIAHIQVIRSELLVEAMMRDEC